MQTNTMWSRPLLAGSGSAVAAPVAGRAIADPLATAVAPTGAPASSWRRVISIGQAAFRTRRRVTSARPTAVAAARAAAAPAPVAGSWPEGGAGGGLAPRPPVAGSWPEAGAVGSLAGAARVAVLHLPWNTSGPKGARPAAPA